MKTIQKQINNEYERLVAFMGEFGVIGLAIGTVIGLSAVSLSKSLSRNIIMPLFGPIFGFKYWKKFHLKIWKFDFGLGHFLSELIYFCIIIFILFITFTVVLKRFSNQIIQYKKEYQTSMVNSQQDIIKNLENIQNLEKKEKKTQFRKF